MLNWVIERTRMTQIAGKWASATQLDPGDNGQIAVMASECIKTLGMRLEDAWLSALVKWTFNHPDPESKLILSIGILRFLDIYGHAIGFSPECRQASREVVEALAKEFEPFKTITNSYPQRAEHKTHHTDNIPTHSDTPTKAHDNKIQPLPPEQISKGDAYTYALEFLSLRLCEENYRINWMGQNRGDMPSLVSEKNGMNFHILLHINIAPTNTSPPPFLITRLIEESASLGAHPRIARVTITNKTTPNNPERSKVTKNNLQFIFHGLEQPK